MPAYLDNLATTPLDPRVLDAMLPVLRGPGGNPHARIHPQGEAAGEAVEQGRAAVAVAAGARPAEVVLTPSATAANNLALLGIAESRARKGRHVLVGAIEHPAVREPAAELSRRGFEVEVVPVGAGGLVDPDDLARRVRDDTVLVSVMAVNNEVGTVQPLAAIRAALAGRAAVLHCDAAQAPGKVPLDLLAGVDLVTFSSHKCYGPMGAAALVVRSKRSIRPRPVVFGGGQEGGAWPGTVNVAAVVGFGVAMRLAQAEQAGDAARIALLADRLEAGLLEAFPGARRNGDPSARVPHCVSVTFEGVDGETLVAWLARRGVAAALGSACSTGAAEPSHVLIAMGRSAAEARRTLRFGLGRFTTDADVDAAVEAAAELAHRMRR